MIPVSATSSTVRFGSLLAADGHRIPLCHVVVGGYSGALDYIKRAVNDCFPVLILKVSACTLLLFYTALYSLAMRCYATRDITCASVEGLLAATAAQMLRIPSLLFTLFFSSFHSSSLLFTLLFSSFHSSSLLLSLTSTESLLRFVFMLRDVLSALLQRLITDSRSRYRQNQY